jgi:hypothetical protein
MICVGIIATATSLLMPALGALREQARLMQCSHQLRSVGQSLILYASQSNFALPPFAFSDMSMDLPLSGHWGGSGQDFNPDILSQKGVAQVNLQVLVAGGLLPACQVICPSASSELQQRQARWFATTDQFSTYCLRVPPSQDLFSGCPGLANYHKMGPLGVYISHAGGQDVPVPPSSIEQAPLVYLDRLYRLPAAIRYDRSDFDGARDVLLADAFWFQATDKDYRNRPVQRGWCHGKRFNALRGDGSVATAEDNGTVVANVQTPAKPLAWDGLYYATYSERVWQFLGRRD